ncbi:hypothetical protein HZA56_07970 [Candidatus Poribacteria bacterium]|nr:hypothetical protein [Candidatus Poribacteria bacterium]
MEQREIDKLISDIEDYLKQVGRSGASSAVPAEDAAKAVLDSAGGEQATINAGLFISPDERKKMGRFLKFSRFASHTVEVLTIGLITTGVLAPFPGWPRTLMFLLGVLLFGIFTITVLLSLHARIELLLQIETNTRTIAIHKARIAATLDKIKLE